MSVACCGRGQVWLQGEEAPSFYACTQARAVGTGGGGKEPASPGQSTGTCLLLKVREGHRDMHDAQAEDGETTKRGQGCAERF